MWYARRMFVDDLKKRVTQAMKEKDIVAKEVLRVALGEIQTAEARLARALTDEEAIAIVRKLVKSNEETLAVANEPDHRFALEHENRVLAALLPATLGEEAVVQALASQRDAILAAKSDGQAVGVAMKHLKAAGLTVDGNVVAASVKKIRAA